MNPTLNEKIFAEAKEIDYGAYDVMSIKGTATKTIVLLLLVVAAASTTWRIFYNAPDVTAYKMWTIGGAIVAFILALIISFKPKRARVLSPIYAVCEGLFLGGVSAMYNNIFVNPETGENALPSLIPSAVIITLLCAFVTAILYSRRVVRVTNKFRRVMKIALISILIFYAITLVLTLFKVDVSMVVGNSTLSIVINLVIVVVAALTLFNDYDIIEKLADSGAPKYMEWYGAFSLTVTLVWLYLEILKLLAKLNSRK